MKVKSRHTVFKWGPLKPSGLQHNGSTKKQTYWARSVPINTLITRFLDHYWVSISYVACSCVPMNYTYTTADGLQQMLTSISNEQTCENKGVSQSSEESVKFSRRMYCTLRLYTPRWEAVSATLSSLIITKHYFSCTGRRHLAPLSLKRPRCPSEAGYVWTFGKDMQLVYL